MSQKELSPAIDETRPDTSRRRRPRIFEHPYVKTLYNQVEKWEGKYHEQVRRTEGIQMKSTHQILKLQRMTAIGQSEARRFHAEGTGSGFSDRVRKRR